MESINTYIVEKLKIDKKIKVTKKDPNKVNPDDGERAQEACKNIADAKEDISKHIDGYIYTTKIKMIIKDGHFLIRPKDIGDDEKIHETSEIGPAFLHDLTKNNLGHLYLIVGYRKSGYNEDYYFFFGKNGELFNDKKEALYIINRFDCSYAPWDSKKGKYLSLRFKPMTIEEASKIPWNRDIHLDYIRFYQ